ncbi:MAG TPA: 3-isopropylmalate dehydrogenase [Acidobacteria bacterium]|jgi:3-isopropylmalate dehydrogenase|nr:3-isopropylmalate dehydrogenase [Acidobacteriota bacterium]MDP6371301.1 3-isopropylmalate dehydrogenase [Vicinamibacterales bacterium]HAK55060.1 3-isopropylmalate dehydrogenase [Acidobacteriota bacterium]|tara:strand:- start:133 stop:1203 length:1071 start_codon:yes stop_codon:yes gene_type:complete
MNATIALLPGDGIGPEVTDAAVGALRAVADKFGHTFNLDTYDVGGSALDAGQPPLPDATLAGCLAADAIFLGAVGNPKFDGEPPDRRPEASILKLRRELGAFANLRPARVWPGLEDGGSLKPEVVKGVDVLVVRELTGGLYYGQPRGVADDGQSAFNTMRYSVEEIERIAVVAFESARLRGKHVTSVDKANVLETSRLWRQTVTALAERYPDVELGHEYVDACALLIASQPSRYDVILTENLFGDILSDESGAIVGSLGLLPSASVGGKIGLFEPVHGSAPDIAGQDKANPIGAIGSAAMLLRQALKLDAEASAVETAIAAALDAGCRTVDLVPVAGQPPIGSKAMAEAIIEQIAS